MSHINDGNYCKNIDTFRNTLPFVIVNLDIHLPNVLKYLIFYQVFDLFIRTPLFPARAVPPSGLAVPPEPCSWSRAPSGCCTVDAPPWRPLAAEIEAAAVGIVAADRLRNARSDDAACAPAQMDSAAGIARASVAREVALPSVLPMAYFRWQSAGFRSMQVDRWRSFVAVAVPVSVSACGCGSAWAVGRVWSATRAATAWSIPSGTSQAQ